MFQSHTSIESIEVCVCVVFRQQIRFEHRICTCMINRYTRNCIQKFTSTKRNHRRFVNIIQTHQANAADDIAEFFDIKSENARHKWRIITIFNQEIVVNSQCINCRLDQTPLVRSTQRRTHTQNAYWNTEAKMVYTRHTTTATTTTNPKKTRQLYREESVAVTQIHIRFFFVDFCSLSFRAVRCVDTLSKRTKISIHRSTSFANTPYRIDDVSHYYRV